MRTSLLVLIALALAVPAAAQQPQPQQPPTAPPPVTAPRPGQPAGRGQKPPTPPPGVPPQIVPVLRTERAAVDARSRNIKLDVTFADTVGPDGATTKTLTMLVLNARNGQIRSTGRDGGIINIDAHPVDLNDGRVSVNLTIEYLPELSAQQLQSGVRLGMLSQSLTVLLDSGKPTVITQSADPRSDRKVTVEVTATVVK